MGDICRLHGEYHCLDCSYLWFEVDDAGGIAQVEGTGGEAHYSQPTTQAH